MISVPVYVKKVARSIRKYGKYKGNIQYVTASTSSCPLAREFGGGMGTTEYNYYSRYDVKKRAKEVGLTMADRRSFISWFDRGFGKIKLLKQLIKGELN